MEAMVGSALFSAGGTAVGTAGLFGAAGSFGAGGLLSGLASGAGGLLLTGASAFGQIAQGQEMAAIAKFNSQQSELQARQERLKARDQINLIKQQLNKDIASQSAFFGARSVLQGEGSAQAAQDAAKRNAGYDVDIARFGGETAANAAMAQSAQYKKEAKFSMRQGVYSGIQTIAGSRSARSYGASLLDGL